MSENETKPRRGRPARAKTVPTPAEAPAAPAPTPPPAQQPAPQYMGRRGPGRPRKNPAAEDPVSEAASNLGRRGLGVKKTITPERREQLETQAREMTKRRIAIRGIVVETESEQGNLGGAQPVRPGRMRVSGTPGA